MPHPFSPIQTQIDHYFADHPHPYRLLEQQIQDVIGPEMDLLEIGCGRTAPTLRQFIGKVASIRGIDLVEFDIDDPAIKVTNESVEAMHSVADNSIDLAFSRSVMEHVENAEAAFSEIHRVLKPGGQYIFLTPNRYDYASIIASLAPNKWHPWIVRKTEGRGEVDTFPTHYQANSRRRIDDLARDHGFTVDHFERLTQYPSYLAFARPLFWVGSQYERLLRSTDTLEALRGWILCRVRAEKG